MDSKRPNDAGPGAREDDEAVAYVRAAEGAAHPVVLERLFRGVIRFRWAILAVYVALLVPAGLFGMRVAQDNSLDRLIVASDPDSLLAREFAGAFGRGEYVVLIAEGDDPYSPDALARFDEVDRKLAAIPRVQANSALGIFRRAKAGFQATPDGAKAFRDFALGTDLFRKQGLAAERFLAMALILDVADGPTRKATLDAVDAAVEPLVKAPAPFSAFRRVGQPYVNEHLDVETREGATRYMPLFGLFVVVIVLWLYRSWRALWAFLAALAASVGLTMGYIGVTGGSFTIVSGLVPMTVLITCTATLVYVHSRYVECPPDVDPHDHHVFALANKFIACSASIFAGAVGFAALAVSQIRPVREMGIWVAVGLLIMWLVTFTLFPALQRIFRTPMIGERRVAGRWFINTSATLPVFAKRWRWVLVPSSLLLCLCGVVALFGIPGVLPEMKLETNSLEYIDHDSALYRDTKRMEELGTGLAVTEVWLQTDRFGAATDAAVLRGLQRFESLLAQDTRVTTVVGLPTIARTVLYTGGRGDRFPDTDDALDALSDQLEQLLPREPMLSRFVSDKKPGGTHVTVITRTVDYDGFLSLRSMIEASFAEAKKAEPALAVFSLKVTGLALLAAKISHHLVPTLVESFGLSVVIIYFAFLLVFRNWAARLMALIPSLFAILVMFLVMRITGMSLNVATILIASTVLGTTENDQIHFFYHYLERRRDGSVGDSLRYTMQVAGRAIVFATLINAGGFMAFALAKLPPFRQFGILSALAFTLSMIADFTALPAGLWMVMRDAPPQDVRDGVQGAQIVRSDSAAAGGADPGGKSAGKSDGA